MLSKNQRKSYDLLVSKFISELRSEKLIDGSQGRLLKTLMDDFVDGDLVEFTENDYEF